MVADTVANALNPRPDGVFPDSARRWGGGGRFGPLLSAKLLSRFSIRKRHLIAPGLNLLNMLQSQVGSKLKFLIFCPCWLRRAKQPHQIEIKPRNDMDHVWDTSSTPYVFCDLWPNEVHQRSTIQKRSNLKF